MTSLGIPTWVQNWQDPFFWVKVPSDYPVPIGFVQLRLRMTGIETMVGPLQEDDAFAWFEIVPTFTELGKDYRAPKNWLPPSNYICATTCCLACSCETPAQW